MADPETQKVISEFIATFYKNILKSSRGKENPLQYLQTRLTSLECYWKDFYNNHLEIDINLNYKKSPYMLENHYETVEEDFIATKAAIRREIEKFNPQPIVSTAKNNGEKGEVSGNIVPTNPFKHLPTVSFPQFSGNQLEWETFRDMFDAMVHKTSLSNVQKFYYLKSSLTGKAAERIRNMAISETNYSITNGFFFLLTCGNCSHVHLRQKGQYMNFYDFSMLLTNLTEHSKTWVDQSTNGMIGLFIS